MSNLIFALSAALWVLPLSYASEPTIGFTWDDNQTNVTYRLYQSKLPGARTNSVATFDTQTNFIRIPFTPSGVPHWYQVTALRDSLESAPSNEIAYIVPWVRQTIAQDKTVIEFLRVNDGKTNVRYTLELSIDLAKWFGDFHIDPEIIPMDGGIEHMKYELGFNLSPNLFARVRVDILP